MAFNGKSYHHVAVGGMILNKDNKILLIKELREYDGLEYSRYTLPGGILENGETIDQGLIREIKEETNLDIEVLGLLGIENWIRNVEWEGQKVKDGIDIGLLGRLLGGTEKPQLEEGITEIRWVKEEELLKIQSELDYRIDFVELFKKALRQEYFPMKEINFSRYLRRMHFE